MKRTIYQTNFERLQKIIPFDIEAQTEPRVVILKSEPYMDLCFEVFGTKDGKTFGRIGHYGVQNGDIMADPEMDLVFHFAPDHDYKAVEATTFVNHYVNFRQVVYPEPNLVNPRAKKECNSFLRTWLINIRRQGHK